MCIFDLKKCVYYMYLLNNTITCGPSLIVHLVSKLLFYFLASFDVLINQINVKFTDLIIQILVLCISTCTAYLLAHLFEVVLMFQCSI